MNIIKQEDIKSNDIIKDFLKLLFDDKPDDALIQTWRLKGKKTASFKDIEKAAAYISKNNQDIYVSVGLPDKDYGPKNRCTANKILGIPGFYADIDIKNPDAHKKQNLPDTIEQARSLAEGHGFDPSIIVHSGHGIQVYWLFKEPWIFDTPEERNRAAGLSRRVTETLRQRAKEFDWGIDGVHDLARVLRIPGTWNCKVKGKEVQATILQTNDLRYNPEDFSDLLVELEDLSESTTITVSEKEAISDELILDQNAEPPAEKLDALLESNEKFKQTWQYKRKEDSFPSGDNSTSEYHMSLAHYAAKESWTPQDAADLLISWNRRHNLTMEKVMRMDYMILTIEKARKRVAEDNTNRALEKASVLNGTSHEKLLPRHERLAAVSQALGFGIIKIIMYQEDDPRVLLITNKGEVLLPSVEHLIKPSKLQQYVATVALVYMRINKKKWPDIANLLLSLVEREEVAEESTAIGRIKSYLKEYLYRKSPQTLQGSISNGTIDGRGFDPFVEHGHWYVGLKNFHRHCDLHGSRESLKSMALSLKRAGCINTSFNLTIKGKPTSRKAWMVPHKISVP